MRTVVDCWETQVSICRSIWIYLKAVSTGPVTSLNFNTVDLSIATKKAFANEIYLRRFITAATLAVANDVPTYLTFSMPYFTPCSESSHTQKFIYQLVFELWKLAQEFERSQEDRYAPPPPPPTECVTNQTPMGRVLKYHSSPSYPMHVPILPLVVG